MVKKFVIKRNGRLAEVDRDKIYNRIRILVNEPYKLHNVNTIELANLVQQGLVDKIHTAALDEHAAKLAEALGTKHREYLVLASRIAISNHHKNTGKNFSDKIVKLYLKKDKAGNSAPAISRNFNKYVNIHADAIDTFIQYDRDYAFDYFGFKTLEKGYLLSDGEIIERPQDLYMRAAIQMYMPLDITKFRNTDNLKKALHAYDMMTQGYYTPATPTLFNSGMPIASLSSCFLLSLDDSAEGILKALHDVCIISKGSGGVGFHSEMIRAPGSLIRGTGGESKGSIPFLKIFDVSSRAFDQGGNKRKGSFVDYLEPHHPDIKKFLNLRINDGGDDNDKCPNLFIALWISDLFMERVLNKGQWSTFCPNLCPGLSDAFGDDYTKLYLKYESEGKAHEQFSALVIWNAIYESHCDSGIPYLMYKDNVNRVSMQNNIGTIKSSNLCVSGDTLILTDKGYYPIKELTECEIPVHNVWNGDIFTPATFAKTGIDQELLEIELTHGNIIKCTPYHKFILTDSVKYYKNERISDAKDLQIGDSIIKNNFPIIEDLSDVEDFPYAYTHGFFTGDGTYETKYLENDLCNNKSLENSDLCGHHINIYAKTGGITEMCRAMGTKLPRITLYDGKKDLIKYFDLNPNRTPHKDSSDRLTFYPPLDLPEKFVVPMNYSIKSKLEWLAGLLDADACLASNGKNPSIQLCSIHLEFLNNVKLLCNTLGVNPIISLFVAKGKHLMPDGRGGSKEYLCKERYRLLFNGYDTNALYELGMPTKRLIYNRQLPIIASKGGSYNKIKSITKLELKEDTYCFNEPLKHRGIFNGLLSKNCTEIVLHSSPTEYSICNLHSICLPKFVEDTYSEEELKQDESERRELDHEYPIHAKMNYKKLAEIAAEVAENINNVIDKTYIPVVEAARGNFRHRPLGIGIQGLADVFLKFGVAFESEKAREINKKISESIYYGALSKSAELCRLAYHKVIRDFDEKVGYESTLYPKHILSMYPILESENLIKKYTKKSDIPKTVGAYSSYAANGGSHLYNGKFHWELYGLTKDDLSGMFDWETLRNVIKIFGVRNSLVTAYMPTGTTSHIMGNSPCFEPYVSNIYQKSSLAGTCTIVNKYLIKYLNDHDLFNPEFANYLIKMNGSIQDVEGIPDSIKELYKTAWEMKMKSIMQLAVDRQPFIDQSQSMNLWFDDYTFDKFSSAQKFAWKNGLKTGSYYIRTRPAVDPQKFTISTESKNDLNLAEILKKQKENEHLINESEEEICISCGS